VNPITGCMIVRNERPVILRRLNGLRKHCKELAVIDQCSTDGTWEIVRDNADFAFQLPALGIADPYKNLLYGVGSCEWVLSMDADEEVSPALGAVLPKLIESEEEVFWLERVDMVNGVRIPILGKDWQPRLFKRGKIRYSGQAHTHPEIGTPRAVLFPDAPIVHQRTFDDVVRRNRARDNLGPEIVGKQAAYIRQVEGFLREAGRL